MYVQQVLLVGLIAFILAVPLGFAGSFLLVGGVAAGLNFDVGRYFLPLESVGLQALSALVVPLVSAERAGEPCQG